MHLNEIFDEIIIKTDLENRDKFQIIEDLLDAAVAKGKVHNREVALHDLIERERYLSTGFENGLAVPHAKSKAIHEMILVLGLCREGLDFDSLDGKPTHFIFLLLSPVDTSGPHIQTLALLARNFQSGDIPERLLMAKDNAELEKILHEFK